VKLPEPCRERPLWRSGRRRPAKLIVAIGVAVVAAAFAIFLATRQQPALSGRSSSTTTDAVVTDVSPSMLDWDAAADEINSVSNNIYTLEQKIDQLWDHQPATTTPEEPPPETTP
jgi:hypothetical protein